MKIFCVVFNGINYFTYWCLLSRPPKLLYYVYKKVDANNNIKYICNVVIEDFLDILSFIDVDCGFKNDSKCYLYGVVKMLFIWSSKLCW